jgi:hypothetical protein
VTPTSSSSSAPSWRAILRASGHKPLHDEEAAYAQRSGGAILQIGGPLAGLNVVRLP